MNVASGSSSPHAWCSRWRRKRFSGGTPIEDASAKPSKRLASLLAMFDELEDADMCLLPLLLGEKLKALERTRAAMLKDCIGARCDVIWSEKRDLFDVTLVGLLIHNSPGHHSGGGRTALRGLTPTSSRRLMAELIGIGR